MRKTQIAGARNVLAAVRPCCVQVIKASVAAAVDNWNDQQPRDWTRSLKSRVSAASAMFGERRFLYASTSWSAAGMFELTSYYDAFGLRITAKSAG
jgi:hypothetical protein